jgi:hypothetical protein
MELHGFAIGQALGAVEMSRGRQHRADQAFDIGRE